MTDPTPTTDGAVEELARDDVARKRFLKMAGKGDGRRRRGDCAGAFIAACGARRARQQRGASTRRHEPPRASSTGAAGRDSGDLAIVNYALTLEYLESQFYAKVIASGLFTARPVEVSRPSAPRRPSTSRRCTRSR